MANQPLKALPRQLAFLAPARKCVVPQVLDVVDKAVQRGAVERHSIILVVPSQHRSDPLALLFQWIMHSSPKLLFQSFQLRLHSLPHRLAHYREPSPSRLPADVREAQKVERLRFPLASTLPIPHCMPAELDQPSLFFMQRQLELSQSLTQFLLKPLGIIPVLKANNKVVCVPHDYYRSWCRSLPPLLCPLIENVVKIDVRQHRTNQSSLP